MATDKEINRRLNLSQQEIALAQQVRQQSARNTISLKLHLPGCMAAAVKEAADQVMDSADIFAASLCNGREWRMQYGETKCSACMMKEEMPLEQAQDWMAIRDRQSLEMERQLYQAAVIPLSEGGAVLYVRFHHIIIDGYGMSLFVQKVLDVLGGRETGRSCFAGQEQSVDKNESGGLEAFWRGYFAEADFEPAIFVDKKDGTSFAGRTFHLPDDLGNAMKAFGERENISVPYMAAAAYAYYLAQATGKPEAVILMPRLNRAPSQRNVLGCYTLLVPVRIRVAGVENFAALCREVRRSSREASAHKETGFHRILGILREEGIESEALSEYVFNFYRFQYRTDLDCRVSFSVAGDMSNHLTFSLFYDAAGGLNLRLDYHEGVYTEEKAGYFADAMFAILAAGTKAASGNTGLQELPVIGEAERRKVTAVRGKQFPVGTELTIPSLFRRAAACYRNRPAVYVGERGLTFGELDALSDRIACGLVRRGIGAGDFAAFMLRRDFWLIPTILGISKSGAAFIPVDPAYPADRIAYIMENSHAACLISSPDAAMTDSYVDIHELAEDGEVSLPEIRQEQPAYMIYTSGTTGRPKGVILSHRGIANIVHPDNNPFNRDIIKNCHGIVAIGSICFDISLFEIFVPLMNGLFVELGSEKAMVDAGELAAHIARHHADVLHCTPSRITAYLANQAFAEALGGIRAVLAAGEVLPGSLVRRLANDYGIRIYNGYGPTETTIGATITEAGDDVSIGRPIANMGILLLDRERRPAPFGAAGEICIYGNGVGIGYMDRPEETASRYLLWNGIRLYRTGDLGYFSEDGRLIYRGRNDRQVKLRGLRIELAEIENVMGEFPGIGACSCIVRKIDKTDHLVGFYTVSERTPADAEQFGERLREYMKSRLTAYMVPDVLKELDTMPQTPNGKTDQKALQSEPVDYRRTYRQPSTERERLLCNAFAETLELDQVGLDDNFFELGGDSLSAVSLLLRVEEALALEPDQLEFGDLYQYPTPSLLTERLFKKTQEQNEAGRYEISALEYRGFSEYLDGHTGGSVSSGFLGNVLITGVTGYLGAHLLIDLLRRPGLCGKIVCLARSKGTLSAARRVKSALFYYAEEDFSQDYGEKWVVAEGDITNPDIFVEECGIPIHTIINSAANVAHFSYGNALERINTDGVKNLIRFALGQRAMLCQISTISVAGMTADRTGAVKASFGEGDFYIGQEIHNKYIYSKYMAEYVLLRAAVDNGLRVRLMRVGNLQGRISDGEFQMNMRSNAFTRQFASYIRIGAVPESVYGGSVNFSPVDETAHNIISLAAIREDAAAFHVYPPDEVRFADLFRGMEGLGYTVKVLPDAEFDKLLQKLKRTDEGRERIEGLFTRELTGIYREIPVSQEITNRYLQALSEGWSTVTAAYIHKYLSALDSLDYF